MERSNYQPSWADAGRGRGSRGKIRSSGLDVLSLRRPLALPVQTQGWQLTHEPAFLERGLGWRSYLGVRWVEFKVLKLAELTKGG